MKSEKSLIKRFMPLLTMLLVLVLVVSVAAPTIAYYIRTGGKVDSKYEPADPSDPSYASPAKPFFLLYSDAKEMRNVSVNVPDEGYPVFVRVAIVVTWLRLTDCTCTPRRCNSCDCGEDCAACEDGDCTDCPEECEDCKAVSGCENCPDCDEDDCEDCEGDCKDCKICGICDEEDGCDSCPDCEEDDCKNCEGDCAGCNGCDKVGCGDCGLDMSCDDENCIGCEECPRCNEDETDDWDVFFALPVEGEDYTLKLVSSANGSWETLKKEDGEDDDDDGIYYYTSRVESSGKANGSEPNKIPLIEECKLQDEANPPAEDCMLSVKIIVQTIQAIGYTDDPDDTGKDVPAWKDAWKNAPWEDPYVKP